MPEPSEMTETLPALFSKRFQKYQSKAALFFKDRQTAAVRSLSWKAWGLAVEETAAGLWLKGVRPGDRIGIISENRPEWTFADLAVLSLGAVTVPIYPTSSAKETAYIVEDAGVKLLFLSNQEHGSRLSGFLPSDVQCVFFDESSSDSQETFSLNQLRAAGRDYSSKNSNFFQEALSKGKPEDVATLIYTSGTTGAPKGVMLTHANFIANYLGASQVISVSEKDLALSFLPLSHVFERLAGYYFFALNGGSIAYAESMKTVPEDLRLFKPTVAASVPRLYEKMYAAIQDAVSKSPPLRRKLFAWAIRVGSRRLQMERSGKNCWRWKVQFLLARALVLKKIKAKLGGRLRFFISGGAPLSRELAEFFYAADVLILEGYGLTETSPVIAVNSERDFRFGTVGRLLSNLEVKIAADGEILTRGPCVMKGYYGKEDATREVIQAGWFHTGDIGELDADGFLRITDRKKDIIVTSGGKNVSPQNIENLVLSDPLFANFVVVGDKKNYLVALAALNRNEAEALAAKSDIVFKTWPELQANPHFYKIVEGRASEKTRDLARYEQIKYFTFLEKELSQESGELTPTLKVKRKFVMEKYKSLIEELYARGDKASAEKPS